MTNPKIRTVLYEDEDEYLLVLESSLSVSCQ